MGTNTRPSTSYELFTGPTGDTVRVGLQSSEAWERFCEIMSDGNPHEVAGVRQEMMLAGSGTKEVIVEARLRDAYWCGIIERVTPDIIQMFYPPTSAVRVDDSEIEDRALKSLLDYLEENYVGFWGAVLEHMRETSNHPSCAAVVRAAHNAGRVRIIGQGRDKIVVLVRE